MKIILDLDTGIDDAMALTYALGHEDAEILGVTSVFGNVEMEQGAKNASAVLALVNDDSVPVFEGADRALNADTAYVQEEASGIFHGRNGIGNVELADGRPVEDQHAVDFIIEQAKKYGKELTLVTTGPLTNAALAIQKDPEAMAGINRIVSMGGALTVPGNVSIVAEANFNKDSEANNVVFSSDIPVTVVGLDVTLRTLLTEHDILEWKEGPNATEASRKMWEIVDYYMHAYDSSYDELAGSALHDPLAVSVALDPNWVEGEQFRIKSLYDDQQGRLVSDLNALNEGKVKNVRVALDVDPVAYKTHFMEKINRTLYGK